MLTMEVDELFAECFELRLGGNQILLQPRPAAEGNHWRVLNEQNSLFAASEHLGVGLFLKCPGIAV